MRRVMIIALLATTLLAHGGSDSGSDTLWGTDGDKVVITATRTQPAPEHDTSPGSPRQEASKKDPCASFPEDRKASCFTAVRITAPDGTALTITDLVAFAPTPATTTTTTEPDNVAIVGLPANFVTTAPTHTQTGTLLDLPATARFTPIGFDTTYGDGDTTTTPTGGRTWDDLHQPQFTPTPTSHTYRDRGTYTAHTTVRYTAEVTIGNGWFPVPGELTIPGPTQQITVYEAHTALVQHTCTEQPTAPGC